VVLYIKHETAVVVNSSNLSCINCCYFLKAVVDVLIRLYPDCAVPALINHSPSFSRFINECCRVAWKFSVSDPPYYIATVADGAAVSYDERLHTTLMHKPSGQAAIEHYVWPVLFDHKHGPVLFQGRVVLKQHTS